MSLRRAMAAGRRTAALVRHGGMYPVLVLTMGKVGTNTLRRSAEARGHRSVAGHFATRQGTGGLVAWRDEHEPGAGSEAVRDLGFSSYFRLLRGLPGRPRLRVLTGTREPVAHSISLFFTVGEGAGLFRSGSPASTDMAALTDRFVAFHRAGGVRGMTVVEGSDWFADEFRLATGLDVYSEAFPVEAGQVVLHGAGVEALVVRCEDLPRVGEAALDAFLGPPVDAVPPQNVGETKRYGDMYRQFLSEVVLPSDLVEQALVTQFAGHFYRQSELEGFYRRWTAG